MTPRIVSLGYAVPEHRISQDDAMEVMGWRTEFARRVFSNAAIDYRYTYVPPEVLREGFSWQEATQFYKAGATQLAVEAARNAMDGFSTEDVGQITFVSVTGYECPSLSYAIAAKLGLKCDVVHSNLLGQGCEAAVPGLERATDYIRTHPGKLALAISSEVCSATWYPAPETDREYLVASAIFGDGAAAAVLGVSEDEGYPEIVDYQSYYGPEYLELLGYRWSGGRLKVVLSHEVPKVVPPLIKQVTDILLERNGLRPEDVSHWILHPGGRAVLENLQQELGIGPDDCYWSWEVMRRFGNMSSATIGVIAKEMFQAERPMEGWVLAATMGAGTAVNAVLLRSPCAGDQPVATAG